MSPSPRPQSQYTNHLGQPVGEPLPDWTERPGPARTAMEGRLCRLEPLQASRHADALYWAHQLDAEGLSFHALEMAVMLHKQDPVSRRDSEHRDHSDQSTQRNDAVAGEGGERAADQRCRQSEKLFASGVKRRVDDLPVDPSLDSLCLRSSELHCPFPAPREDRSGTAEIKTSDVWRLYVRNRRNPDEVAGGVLAGEPSELECMLA